MASNAIRAPDHADHVLVESTGVGGRRESPSNPRRKARSDRVDCCPAQLLIRNRHNFARSGLPARLMYYRNGSWLDFSSQVVSSLKPSFVERRPVVDASVDGTRYLFDFLRMLQIDFATGNRRSVAWIDEDGKCFFPTSFVGEQVEDNCPDNCNVGNQVPLGENSLKRKRDKLEVDEKKELEQEVSSADKRHDAFRRPCLFVNSLENGSSKWPNASLLKGGDKTYLQIKNFFLSGLKNIDPTAAITAIHQCTGTGPLEKARYEVFQKQVDITKNARGMPNIVYAWHGTSAKRVSSILAHGFGPSSCVSVPKSYGIGVYFSPIGLPHLSTMESEADDNGEKHVVLCRVILGNVEKVDLGSKQSHPSSMDFDSGADDPNNPKHYIVWFSNVSTHVIPEFVVSYKASDVVKGLTRGMSRMKHSIAELFSKMKNALPPTKVQEVEMLYSVFRAGKLAKDSFVKQLRSVAGDDALLSAIREIRGSG